MDNVKHEVKCVDCGNSFPLHKSPSVELVSIKGIDPLMISIDCPYCRAIFYYLPPRHQREGVPPNELTKARSLL